MRILIGLSGASGAIYGIRLVEVLASLPEVETHVIISRGAHATIEYETDHESSDVAALADQVHDNANLAAGPASGTFPMDGMVVAPCSMKTLAAIASGFTDSLLVRAADVALKERRPLIVVPRETPLHLGHLKNMVTITKMGGVVLPPVPGFYAHPTSIDDLVNHTITKILDQFAIDAGLTDRWTGL